MDRLQALPMRDGPDTRKSITTNYHRPRKLACDGREIHALPPLSSNGNATTSWLEMPVGFPIYLILWLSATRSCAGRFKAVRGRKATSHDST